MFNRIFNPSLSQKLISYGDRARLAFYSMALFYHRGSRWHLIKQPIFWLKILQIVIAALIVPFCITYHDQAELQMVHSSNSYNITVKYPFHYDNSTAVYTDEDKPPKFNLDPAIEVCVQMFVVVVIVTGAASLCMVLLACCPVHRSYSQAKKLLITEIFIAVVMAFLLVVSTSLWLYNLLDLKNEVEKGILSVIEALADCSSKNLCVESLPDYAILYASVGLGYLSFVLWLTETVLVYCHTVNQNHTMETSALVWAQELPETTPPPVEIQHDTAT